MSVKGEDLELRVPQPTTPAGIGERQAIDQDGETRTNGTRMRQRLAQRAPTVWVDQTLILCRNHAYEVASAHGAAEVMLEHLIHALTRVPDAVAVLEARGVHVAALRRESAAVISTDIPLAVPSASAKIAASGAFDEAVLAAAAHARQRGEEAAGVRDVLFALLAYGREGTAVELLKRHWPSWRHEEALERRALRPLLAEPAPFAHTDVPVQGRSLEDRLAALESGMRALMGSSARERAELTELVTAIKAGVIDQRTDAHGHASLISDRLARLEKAIEAERGTGGGDLGSRLARIETMQETLLAQRASLANLESALSDRLQRLELAIDGQRAPAGLGERLANIERAVESRLAEAAGAEDAAAERLMRLQAAVETIPAGLGPRFESLAQVIAERLPEGGRAGEGAGERLAAIERSLSAQRAEIAHLQNVVRQDLEALLAHASEPRPAASLPELIEQRLADLARAIDGQRQEIVAHAADQAPRFAALDQAAAGRAAESQGLLAAVTARIGELETALGPLREAASAAARERESDRAETATGLARIHGAQQTLSAAVDQWRQDNATRLTGLTTTLAQIESASTRPVGMLEGLTARLDVVRSEVSQVTRIQKASIRARGFWRWLFGLR